MAAIKRKPADFKYPKTREEARKLNLRFYGTGKKCKNGHVALRYTSSGTCCTCLQHHSSKRHGTRQLKDYTTESMFAKLAEIDLGPRYTPLQKFMLNFLNKNDTVRRDLHFQYFLHYTQEETDQLNLLRRYREKYPSAGYRLVFGLDNYGLFVPWNFAFKDCYGQRFKDRISITEKDLEFLSRFDKGHKHWLKLSRLKRNQLRMWHELRSSN